MIIALLKKQSKSESRRAVTVCLKSCAWGFQMYSDCAYIIRRIQNKVSILSAQAQESWGALLPDVRNRRGSLVRNIVATIAAAVNEGKEKPVNKRVVARVRE